MNRTSIDEQQRTEQEERLAGRRAEQARARRHGEEARTVDVARLREVSRNLGTQIEEQTRKRPLVAVGAAAGIGFVAGSLFGSRLGQVLLAAAAGYVAKNVLGGDLGVERLQENLERMAHERSKI